MKNELVRLVSDQYRMYEGIPRRSQTFGDIVERMYSSQKIDRTFLALGKAIGDDYSVSDRALGMYPNDHHFIPQKIDLFASHSKTDLNLCRCSQRNLLQINV